MQFACPACGGGSFLRRVGYARRFAALGAASARDEGLVAVRTVTDCQDIVRAGVTD